MTAATGAHWRQWHKRPALRRDWDQRFSEWLELTSCRPHRFGHFDCLMQPAGAIEAQTGRDFGEGHRGRYRSARGAAAYLRRLGFSSPGALLDSILDPVPPAFAQRGDIALVNLPDGEGAPGVVIGGEALFMVHGAAEPLRLPRAMWVKAWSVGRRTVGAGE
jgi:uncharacterized protein DUF6950